MVFLKILFKQPERKLIILILMVKNTPEQPMSMVQLQWQSI